jgi:hypothetical protein
MLHVMVNEIYLFEINAPIRISVLSDLEPSPTVQFLVSLEVIVNDSFLGLKENTLTLMFDNGTVDSTFNLTARSWLASCIHFLWNFYCGDFISKCFYSFQFDWPSHAEVAKELMRLLYILCLAHVLQEVQSIQAITSSVVNAPQEKFLQQAV